MIRHSELRRHAENALIESQAVTRSIVETAVDGIITADQDGFIESFNPAAEKLIASDPYWGH